MALDFRELLSWYCIFGLCAKAHSLPVWPQSTSCQQSCKQWSEGQFSLPSLSPVSPFHFIFVCQIRKFVSSENVPDKTKQLLIRPPIWLAAWVPARARGGIREPGVITLAAPHAQAVLRDGRVEERLQAWLLIQLAYHHWCYFLVWSSQWDADDVSCSMTFLSGCNTVKSYRVYIIVTGNSSFKQDILLWTVSHTYTHTLSILLILAISVLVHSTDCMAKSVQRMLLLLETVW